MKNWLQETSFTGKHVNLIPLQLSHRDALMEAATDGELWKLWYTSVPNEETIEAYLATAMEMKANGTGLPFAVQEKATGKIIGCTRYCNSEAQNRRVEIGYTWYAKSYQRTGINTDCKLLLLQHAFESLDCIAVAFLTNWFNFASRKAIARLGAKQDGVLRNHRISPDGTFRDTVVFSIVRDEWPTVRKSLIFELQKY